jgi:hypothetical protein
MGSQVRTLQRAPSVSSCHLATEGYSKPQNFWLLTRSGKQEGWIATAARCRIFGERVRRASHALPRQNRSGTGGTSLVSIPLFGLGCVVSSQCIAKQTNRVISEMILQTHFRQMMSTKDNPGQSPSRASRLETFTITFAVLRQCCRNGFATGQVSKPDILQSRLVDSLPQ